MSKVYMIGDTHYGHRNITKYRPEFSSMRHHDEFVHSQVMSVSGKRNILWLLGDNFFEPHTVDYLRDYKKHFMHVNWVIGNHDTDKPHRVEILKQIVREDLVHKIGSLFKVSGFWVSHHPMHKDELWGKKNIHGHVHTNTIRDSDYLNLSCDNLHNYVPADLQYLKSLPLHMSLQVFGK